MKRTIIYLLILTVAMASCNKFLDEPSSKTNNIKPTKVEHLEALLDNYTKLNTESDLCAIYGSDDMGCYPEIMSDYQYINIDQARFHFWDKELATLDSKKSSWVGEWQKIFLANSIFYFLPKVEGDNAKKEQLKLEAYFMRAYSYMRLVNIYCLPYTETNKKELGLPIKETTSFTETSTRATLEDTYTMIERDIEQALKLTNKIEKIGTGINNSWRANKAAAYALSARFWLMKGKYAEAGDFADKALKEYNVLVDYNKDMRFSPINHTVKDGANNSYKLNYPYTFDNDYSNLISALEWPEFYYFRLLQEGYSWFVPSQDLLASYDKENDLRYKYHMVQHYSFVRGMKKNSIPGYIFFFNNKMPSGLSVSEMILTKAECQARQGQWQEAMVTINVLYAKRTLPGNKLTANSKEEAIKEILKERRRELPFTIRWFDMRRLNHNDDPTDDIVVVKKFYSYKAIINVTEPTKEYNLPNGSLHYAYPIPEDDIIATQGALLQNRY